jgi:hypothetical protein
MSTGVNQGLCRCKMLPIDIVADAKKSLCLQRMQGELIMTLQQRRRAFATFPILAEFQEPSYPMG